MHRSEFLERLRTSVLAAVDAEFRPVGRSAQDCPYVVRTLARYASRSASSLLRFIRHFAHPPAAADASALIGAVVQRARSVARRIVMRQGRRAQGATENGAAPTAHDPTTIRAQLGHGRALDVPMRSRMEESFGTSFASVRIHADTAASRLNKALGARAFTLGQEIAFGAGQYRPHTTEGDYLIAHELAHTLQQRPGVPGATPGPVDWELERQADCAAAAAVTGRAGAAAPVVTDESEVRVQRLPIVLAGGLVLAEARRTGTPTGR